MGTNAAIVLGTVRHFMSDTALTPTSAGEPTLAEVQAYLTANLIKGVLVYYTGTDLDTDSATYIYDVDSSGSAIVVKEPAVVAPLGISTVSMNASQALTTWNRFYNISSATGDFVLTMPPSANADQTGDVLEIFNSSENYISIAADASDTVEGSATPMVIQPNGAVTVKTLSFNKIIVIGAGRSIVSSLANSGFTILGDSLMLQWGEYTSISDDEQTVTFDTNFGEAPYFFDMNRGNAGADNGANQVSFEWGSATVNSIIINPTNASQAAGDVWRWFAIGKAP